MGLFWQAVSTAIASYLSMSMGIMFTWPSSTLLLFSSENTTLSRPMTINEQSLLGSLSSFGALISTPVSGWMLDSIGRKYSCIVLSMTHVIAWAMIALSDSVEVILASTFVSGIGGAFFVVVPIYISEFCQQSIRGGMTSGATVFYTLGMLISYWFGGTLSYYTMVYTCFCIALVGVLLLGLMRESPVYLMQKGTEEQARNAIAFFRSVKPYDKEVVEEINAIRRALTPDLMADTPATDEDEKMVPFEMKPATEKLSTLQFLKKSKSTRRAFAVTIILATACLFQGLLVLMVFAEPLFKMAVPSMSSMVCSIIMAALCLVAGIAAAYLCDVVGRKSVMIYSSLASGVCCVVLGTQIHLQWSPPILTVLMIFLFCVVYTLGAGTIPYVISSEVFLPEIRGFCSMMVMEWFNVCAFLVIYIFNPLVQAVGLGPLFYFFGAVCFGTAVFTSAYLPETKGLAVDEIQFLFAPKSLKKGTVSNDEHMQLDDKC